MLAACNICFLKTINYTDAYQSTFCVIDGLNTVRRLHSDGPEVPGGSGGDGGEALAQCDLLGRGESGPLSRAGHLRYFFNFPKIKKDFLHFFLYQFNNLFLHQSQFKKPTPSQINSIRNEKNHFLLLKNFKNTASAQL